VSRSSPGTGPQYLLDGMSLAFRAYFALPPDLATESGAVTNALHGFVSMLINIVRDQSPAALAVAFDLPGGTFRDDLVEEYKAGRAETPDDLMPQFDMIREVLGALCVPVVGVPGYEADDVLATLATEARDRDCDVVVVTGDRDCFQLVEDPHVRVLYNRRGVSDYTLYDEAGIIARTGVEPRKYPMLAAMRGDPSDNLPGVPGVGEKTAAKLLNTYDDIDGIYAHLDALSPKLRENLAAHEAEVRANLEVIPLVRDVVMDVNVEDLSLGGWDRGIAAAAFERYELRTLWKRVSDLLDEGRLGQPRDAQLPASGPAAPERAPIATGHPTERAASASAAPAPAPPPPTADPGEEVALADIPPPLPAATEPAVLEHCPVASEAVTALRALPESVGDGTVVVTGWWDGTPGRSALRGLGLMGPGSPPVGMWLRSHQLEQATVRKALNTALAETPVAGHQVKELLRSLLPIGIDCTGLVMDTAVAAYLLDPNRGDYSLASLVGEDLVAAPHLLPLEGDGGLVPDGRADPVAVAAAEAAAVHRLVAPYRERLDAEGLGPLHDEVERPLVRVLAKMEVAGIRVDVDELRRISDELVAETSRLEAEIHRLAGHEFNVNSTPQLRTVLYDELGLTPGRKTKTGYSTDAATLESLRDDHPIVETLLGYREVEKLRSTYGESLLAEVAWDGRIHASFRQTVARTGRLSSDRPNLHNIPVRTDVGRRFRRAFVPEQGMRFLVADYDQVELRVIAHLSGDPGLIEAFTSGADVHRTVASGVYGVPAEEVTKAQRDRAKMVSYGLAYGMEPFGLARRLSSSVDEANEISDRYFAAFPKVKEYMEETVAEARRRGFTRTALGRKRPLPDLDARNYRDRQAAGRQAMNAGIQGLAADIFKTALVRLDRALEEGALESRLVLQIHDEVILEVRPGEEDRVVELTRSMLVGAADLSVPLEVSMGLGDSWDGAKP
jgi:DNA polymerase I